MQESLELLKSALEAAGFKYTYNLYPTPQATPTLPYITVRVTSGECFHADDESYWRQMTLQLMLFCGVKDPALETSLAEVLRTLGINYAWVEGYDEHAKLYVITFTFAMDA